MNGKVVTFTLNVLLWGLCAVIYYAMQDAGGL